MDKNQFGTQRPYIASYVLIKKDGKYGFVLRRNTGWMDDHYGLPAGKVENGESFIACALREAKEEVGIVVKPEHLEHVLTMHRLSDGNARFWVDVFFMAGSWDGEAHNAEESKASKFEWLDPHNLPENIIPNVRFAMDQIRLGNKYCEFDWDIEIKE